MRIRFYNGLVLTGSPAQPERAELWVKDDRIEYVGAPREDAGAFDREIDLAGDLVMPGFKNAHTHSAMTFLRSYADDLPLLDWLNQQVFPMEAKLTADDVYHLAKLAILEYLAAGITANFDMYMFAEANAAASRDMGFRTVLCGCIHDFYNTPDGLRKMYEDYNKGGLVSCILGFHAEYTCSESLLREISAIAHEYKAPVFAHNSESASEVAGCFERHGTTPTAYLDSLGLFDYGGGGYHCIHLFDEDKAIFRDRGLWAVSCPGSNTKLASGIAPLTQLHDMGVHLALGTDGPASNNCLDMFREMFLATGLQKLANKDASAMAAETVFEMATRGGALAMGLADCDTLAPGKKADLTVLDMRRPNMQPVNAIVKNIVYSGSTSNIRLTMIDGRILYENGSFFVGESADAIYEKANAIINRMRG